MSLENPCPSDPCILAGVEPFLNELQQPVSVEIHSGDDPLRSQVEGFIRSVFLATYGAKLNAFHPTLLSFATGPRLRAAVGLRGGLEGPMFAEQYLRNPVESLIAVHWQQPAARERVVEVGNLALTAAGEARWLIAAVTAFLHACGYRWVVFTAVQPLFNAFQRLGLMPIQLAPADPARLPDGGCDWGSYYDRRPVVCAGDIRSGIRKLGGVLSRQSTAAAPLAAGLLPPGVDIRVRRGNGAGACPMNLVISRIAEHARRDPQRAAVSDACNTISYGELQAEIERLSPLFTGHRVALLLANGGPWAVLDLAALHAGATCIPLPAFFSDAQLQHVLTDARPELVITDQPQRLTRLSHVAPEAQRTVAGSPTTWFRMSVDAGRRFPEDTRKLTYTSGTTGTPKGVCLGDEALQTVSVGLSKALRGTADDRTLSLLPLSTLLENIGGLYSPLYSGAHAFVPDLSECGIRGSSGVDAAALVRALHRFRPSSTIVVPQLLKAMVMAIESGAAARPHLRFVAVGGARTAPTLIARARQVGLPVFEGYGLSEACSVVTLNMPGSDRLGSVGQPLPHARVRITDDGEVVVGGALFKGYLGQLDASQEQWRTGDLGYFDRGGYLHITGRADHAFTTAFGRNVSPEWVESELLGNGALLQAAVYGDGMPYNVAVLVVHPTTTGAGHQGSRGRGQQPPARLRPRAALGGCGGTVLRGQRPRQRRGRGRSRLGGPPLWHRTRQPVPSENNGMSVYERLVYETGAARIRFMAVPILQRALQGNIGRDDYLAFLGQAYHHVSHTVPLLANCRERLPARLGWLQTAMDEYIEEEAGHELWILDDIRAAGGDADAARDSAPLPTTELMVAYAYDLVNRRNPVGFLGMVFVLESTSVQLASRAASVIRDSLRSSRAGISLFDLPWQRRPGTYRVLSETGQSTRPTEDQDAVVHSASMFYRLYGDIFASLSESTEINPRIAQCTF